MVVKPQLVPKSNSPQLVPKSNSWYLSESEFLETKFQYESTEYKGEMNGSKKQSPFYFNVRSCNP